MVFFFLHVYLLFQLSSSRGVRIRRTAVDVPILTGPSRDRLETLATLCLSLYILYIFRLTAVTANQCVPATWRREHSHAVRRRGLQLGEGRAWACQPPQLGARFCAVSSGPISNVKRKHRTRSLSTRPSASARTLQSRRQKPAILYSGPSGRRDVGSWAWALSGSAAPARRAPLLGTMSDAYWRSHASSSCAAVRFL